MSRREIEMDQLAAEDGFLVIEEDGLSSGRAGGRVANKIPLNKVVEIRREASGRYRVVIEFAPSADAVPIPARIPGSAKGLFVVPDDFDTPLDDFQDYM